MKPGRTPRRKIAGVSLVEIMIAGTIGTLTIGLTLSTFLTALRTMYKDTQRMATNAALRGFTLQVAKETLDSTEFHLFPSYESLDGTVSIGTDVSPSSADETYETYLAYGDCLVLVTRVSTDDAARVRQFRIYYRHTTAANTIASIRYYESADYGATGHATKTLEELVNEVNLKNAPTLTGSRQLVARARGRLKKGSTTECYPIFSTESATTTPTNDSVSLNVEIINGTTTNNLLSSSCFNYTISPRR